MADQLYCLRNNCECGKQTTIMEIAYNADGEVLIEGICVVCGKQTTFKYHMFQMVKRALELQILDVMYKGGVS